LCPENEGHASTPRRSGVFWAKVYSQVTGHRISTAAIEEATKIPPRTQSHILKTGHARTLHNVEDGGPDPRGSKPAFTKEENSAIADYLDYDTITLEEKGKPWQDIVVDSGHPLPQTYYFKPPGYRDMEAKGIQHTLKEQ
jgi:hypothetical protein